MSFALFWNNAGSDGQLFSVLLNSTYTFNDDEFVELLQLTIHHHYYTSMICLLDRCHAYKNRNGYIYNEFWKAMHAEQWGLALYLVQFLTCEQRERFLTITGRENHIALYDNVQYNFKHKQLVAVELQQRAQIAFHLLQYVKQA